MSNKKFADKAKEFFADPKNANVTRVYVTSDGCLFRALHYANDWKTRLTDREIETYSRFPDLKKETHATIVGENQEDNTDPVVETNVDSDNKERDALVKEYIELFDTRPAHNIGLEKLKAKIEEKKAEGEDAGSENE